MRCVDGRVYGPKMTLRNMGNSLVAVVDKISEVTVKISNNMYTVQQMTK